MAINISSPHSPFPHGCTKFSFPRRFFVTLQRGVFPRGGGGLLQEEGVVGAISKPITSLITGVGWGVKKGGRVERVTAAKLPIILHFPHFLGGKGRVFGGCSYFLGSKRSTSRGLMGDQGRRLLPRNWASKMDPFHPVRI